ncbi:hypothetical protein M2139_000336 [Enterococcus sp. PF1-24]|uniref:hypothetical protein n=1 Tax=unclassified Enterococcus TaxID=2608891 RepID=UPI00247647C8|nr:MULTISPECIES: hypothetical protein [unclassified Enterococcus]MDH6363244.1 hypothetical protein [Enterococcus sp. PFB1-1]MDH6400455.1 hypothetical protein [Enterococcus sp. PF1-24]
MPALKETPEVASKVIEFYENQEKTIRFPLARVTGENAGACLLVTIGFEGLFPEVLGAFQRLVSEISVATITGELILLPYVEVPTCRFTAFDADGMNIIYSNQKNLKESLKNFFDENFLKAIDEVIDVHINDFFM